nr:putative reverse transcriptase domain-containing protein [Tanacetum cinerariifolium]
MGIRVGRGGRGRRPREGNDERVDELSGQGNDQGLGANGSIEGVNGNVVGVNGSVEGAPDFSTIIAQQLQNLLPAMLAQVGNQGNVGNKMISPHLVTPKSRKIKRNGSIKKVEKRGNVGEPSKDKNGKDDNKRTRTGNVFASTANPVGRDNTGVWPKCTTYNSYHAPRGPCRTCFNCNLPCHLEKDCRGMPRNVNPVNVRNPSIRTCYECGTTDHVRSAYPRLNRAHEPEGNRPNQVAANNGSQGWGNQARGRAFMLGAEEAHQDSNIMTGMDWLSNHKAKIICHEQVVRIPLLDGNVLRVLGERLEEKVRLMMSAKASDKKQKEIVVVKDFPQVFLDDLSRLPPAQEIEFRIELISGATPVAKSSYRLAPSKLKELSRQLKEL